MGCDIHMFIEKRQDQGHAWYIDEHHTLEDEFDESGNIKYLGQLSEVSATCRNYALFGVLAGVRGGGCLFKQRGVPEDASPEYLEAVKRYGGDGHSYSWLMLDEFKKCLLQMGGDLDDLDDLDDLSLSTDAFYNIEDYWGKEWSARPPHYSTVYRYGAKWIRDQIEAQKDIDPMFHLTPEVRVLFYFDN